MTLQRFGRLAAGAAAILLPLAGGQVASAAIAPAAAPAAVVDLHYDASGVPDYRSEATQAAANWNNAEHNVRLSSGGRATIILHEVTGGGSYTQTDGHGHGDIYIDRDQVAEGNDPTRILAHEFGHNLGLPDHYSGPCSEIMSGHGPGTSCKNAKPNAQESARVDRNFANGLAAVRTPARHVYR
ncbi:snapalysin family zinc-dependent metalloprotease [Amycolatopsis sp. PS_44_ISF1]|uniref:snapalysin family zinc-dependent metalloprotease n=1 Tax=Amycolatopsis sp. PS_44_ISF1 TaxID=2974917 RepID=UPI0028DF7C63|nr:snapalysin family zinc-dependent metalloprotease [Amycolatopsis sp. PS_44_ISF1]MDT8913038.1 snapalysin family zinc-dependent metalloprotease [Amycolatopsis sp. PS_44_ISF1]